ncbi:triple gene block protein 2 [Pseudostellaria heterophylla carlavirus 2]|uniref:Movement protein TGB2 n=1 Tax=Pseudostellaria heterophylla carlavirus 2 TaxID=2982811 RepID=A0A977TNI6_9VIRU|nr:triple gene block protein 2 [Pseudostellaria heterophylla carlavirus 2]
MPLLPPPDNTKAFFALAVGVSGALCLHFLTRSNLPFSGDNIHSLPHGGNYVDGTKAIRYNRASEQQPKSPLHFELSKVLIVAFILASVCLLKYLHNPRSRCNRCGRVHC